MQPRKPARLKPDDLQRLATDIGSHEFRTGKQLRVTVTGGSMRPVLLPGDIVIVDPSQGEYLDAGDVITFMEDGTLLTHRVVQVQEDRLVTKGDGTPYPDSAIFARQVIGPVVARERAGRLEGVFTNRTAILLARISHFEGRLFEASRSFGSRRLWAASTRWILLPLRWLILFLSTATIES